VKAERLPSTVDAWRESHGLPAPFAAGWTWCSLDPQRWLEPDELDALTAAAGAPALAFAVHDSDEAYLVGADDGRVAFRVTVNGEDAQETDGLAAWAARNAPVTPEPGVLADVLSRTYVFAEAGLSVVFSRLGLLPAEIEAEELDEDDDDTGAPPLLGIFVQLPPGLEGRALAGERRHTWLDAGDGLAWCLLVAEEEREAGLDGWFAYACAPEVPPLGAVWPVANRDGVVHYLRLLGGDVRLGEWAEVPDDVERTLRATLEWVASRPRPDRP
jgi:hypothetical protein